MNNNKRLVYGMGNNDSDFTVSKSVNGKRVTDHIYRKWKSMLERCYSAKVQERQPTYAGCSVAEEWLLFSNFRDWMVEQDHEGMELDKDIKHIGNKVYSPDTCLFVPSALNRLLIDSAAARGEWPIGVCFDKARKRFMAQINIDGKKRSLGRFATPEAASDCYQQARTAKIRQLIEEDTYPVATQYLAQHI